VETYLKQKTVFPLLMLYTHTHTHTQLSCAITCFIVWGKPCNMEACSWSRFIYSLAHSATYFTF